LGTPDGFLVKDTGQARDQEAGLDWFRVRQMSYPADTRYAIEPDSGIGKWFCSDRERRSVGGLMER